MSIRCISVVLSALAIISICVPAEVAAGTTAPLPPAVSRMVSIDRETRLEELRLPGTLVPYWDRGFAIRIESLDSFSPQETNVSVFGADARRLLAASVWPEGAAQVSLTQAVIAPEGVVVAAGSAIMKDRSRMGFIVKLDREGNTVKTVNTNPVTVVSLCVADDGTVWALATDPDKHDRGEDFPMLKQYSFEEGLLHEDLPRASFPRILSPLSLAVTQYSGDPGGTYLRCGRERVALYVGRTREYIEIDPTTRRLSRFKVDTSSIGRIGVTGLAVVDGGPVVAALSEADLIGLTGLFELVTDVTTMTASWVPVQGTVSVLEKECGEDASEGQFLRLWGAQNGELVVERRAGQSSSRVSWERLEPISTDE